MSRAAVALVFVLGCGGGVQQATILPHATALAPDAAPAERWTMIPSRSRIDVVGVDVTGGKHPVTFDRWTGEVLLGEHDRFRVDVDMRSARGESAFVTHLLEDELLEADRFPTATLAGRIDRATGLVEANATIHGVERGLRFHGALTREGAEVHFVARFKISRDAFGIHSPASWDGLVKDDVHLYVDVRAKKAE